MKSYSLQTLGFGFVLLGSFLLLLSLFDDFSSFGSPWYGPFFWSEWIYSISFYSGIGFVITGSVSIITARKMTTGGTIDTPTSVEDQKVLRGRRLSHLPIDLGIALIAGLIVSAANTFAARDPFTSSSGFPFAVKFPIENCHGPFLGGCVSYAPWALALDAALWVGLTFVIVAFTDLITAH